MSCSTLLHATASGSSTTGTGSANFKHGGRILRVVLLEVILVVLRLLLLVVVLVLILKILRHSSYEQVAFT